MPDEKVLRSIHALARDECMKYRNGLCSETDAPCHLMNNDCGYLMDHLVPAHWEFDDLVAYALWYAADEIRDDDTGLSDN